MCLSEYDNFVEVLLELHFGLLTNHQVAILQSNTAEQAHNVMWVRVE